jgi:hypothetical protein
VRTPLLVRKSTSFNTALPRGAAHNRSTQENADEEFLLLLTGAGIGIVIYAFFNNNGTTSAASDETGAWGPANAFQAPATA